MNRIERIKKLHSQGLTLKEIGQRQRPRITAERVRQLLYPKKMKYCARHKCKFEKSCLYCVLTSVYPKVVSDIRRRGKNALAREFERLKPYDRSKSIVLKRAYITKLLRDQYKLSFPQIAKLLDRDHTTIMNLYKKEF